MGVNIGAMIGVGVFISAGFMADTMGPELILVAWLAGGVLAMAGARAYAELAARIPRSGGEYRYLSELFHPWLGYFAGWASLLAGFSAPVATNAKTLVPFANTLVPGVELTHVGALIIVATTLVHAFDLGLSRRAQDVLAGAKVVLVIGFIVVGVLFGSRAWPAFTPPHVPAAGTLGNFMEQLVYVIYAYIGWNTAAYAAEEFDDPRRTVPRSMILGAAAVTAIYLLVNWIFVANLSTATVGAFLGGDPSRVTFGHVITTELIGPTGGKIMSVLVVVVLVSAISAMTMVGPRVYQAMARDGFLPRVFAGDRDRPPLFSVLLQGVLALIIFYTHEIRELVTDIGVVLTVTAALAVATLFTRKARAGWVARVCAAIFIAGSGWMLVYQATRSAPTLWIWIASLLAATTVAYAIARRRPVP